MKVFIKVILISFLITGLSLHAQEAPPKDSVKTVTQDGLTISVVKIEDDLKGFKKFRVVVANDTASQKSVELLIHLGNSTRKEPPGKSGSCTVFLGIEPHVSAEDEKQCKETAFSDIWSFEVKKVYNFILDK